MLKFYLYIKPEQHHLGAMFKGNEQLSIDMLILMEDFKFVPSQLSIDED
jgi:hypothetical protein